MANEILPMILNIWNTIISYTAVALKWLKDSLLNLVGPSTGELILIGIAVGGGIILFSQMAKGKLSRTASTIIIIVMIYLIFKFA